MPHCIVEASESIQNLISVDQISQTVFQAAVDSELFSEVDIRARTELFESHIAGSNSQHFIHVTVKLLAGRTSEQKSHLANLVLSRLEGLAITNAALSVEISDLFPESYVRKLV